MPTRVRNTVMAWLMALALAGGVARAQVIDRILAVVDGAIITHSDLLGAIGLGLAGPGAAREPVSAVLDRLIERRLILTEVERYAPPEPPDADVDRQVAQLRASAASPEQFDAVVRNTGIAVEELRHLVRDNLRIASYLEQRFGAATQPSEDVILQYYRDHQPHFTRGGVVLSYAEAYPEAQALLVAERRAATVGQWVAGLRRRANVNVLPVAQAR
jgi:hypothetical protein